jgi:hypothetical protein
MLQSPSIWNFSKVGGHVFVRLDIGFASNYDFGIGFWNCSDRVVFCFWFFGFLV